jgi:H+/Cl- antiporter ClcA
MLGLVIGGIGYFVSFFTAALDSFKFDSVTHLINDGHWEGAFFVLLLISLFFSCVAGLLCWMEPMAASTGIPQIKAYLNGINLNKAVRIRVLVFKVIGMCFSVAAGLPLGMLYSLTSLPAP